MATTRPCDSTVTAGRLSKAIEFSDAAVQVAENMPNAAGDLFGWASIRRVEPTRSSGRVRLTWQAMSPAHRPCLPATILYGALLCWAAGILWLSSLTPDELPDQAFLPWDKLSHVLAFALGGWLAATALRVSRPALSVPGAVIAAVGAIAAFGVLDEVVQTFTPGRTGGDLRDWIADVVGAVIGASVSLLTQRRICSRRPKAGVITPT